MGHRTLRLGVFERKRYRLRLERPDDDRQLSIAVRNKHEERLAILAVGGEHALNLHLDQLAEVARFALRKLTRVREERWRPVEILRTLRPFGILGHIEIVP